MITATSNTIAEAQKNELSESSTVKRNIFTISASATGEKLINDELLSEQDASQERAVSEFLIAGYSEKIVTFTTYQTDLFMNQNIKIKGLWYKIKSIAPFFDKVKGTVTIKAVRYE